MRSRSSDRISSLAVRRAQHRRESDAVKACLDECVQRPAKLEVARRHGHPRRHLHLALHEQERRDAAHERVEAAAAALEGPESVVDFAGPVDAHRHRKAEILEEAPVLLGEQGAVGGDREAERSRRERQRVRAPFRVAACKTARLTSGSPPRKARLRRAPGFRRADQELDRAQRLVQRHVLRRAAELALLGVAIGAAEIALLRDRERKSADRRRIRAASSSIRGGPPSPACLSASSTAST